MNKQKQIEEMFEDLVEFEHRYIEYCLGNTCHACGYYGDGECDNHIRAEYLYNAGYRKQSEWISVEERLPEQYTAVIVCDENRFIGEAEYDGDGFRWVSDENLAFATHWMPLPDAPKGE